MRRREGGRIEGGRERKGGQEKIEEKGEVRKRMRKSKKGGKEKKEEKGGVRKRMRRYVKEKGRGQEHNWDEKKE